MPVVIDTPAVEESTYVVTASFTDENDTPVVPNTITWSLTDLDGDPINYRSDVEVLSPAASITLVLKGDDLQIAAGEGGSAQRILTLEATYDSSLGNDLPLKESMIFRVLDLTAVP